MTRRNRPANQIDVAEVLNRPVGSFGRGGQKICAYEANMRHTAIQASVGNMPAARRFLGQLQKYGLLKIPEDVDDHKYIIRVPKEWEYAAWLAMYDRYGDPPWPGKHDGLIPRERWQERDGRRPKRRARRIPSQES